MNKTIYIKYLGHANIYFNYELYMLKYELNEINIQNMSYNLYKIYNFICSKGERIME